jgi:hypothetical protein
MQREPVKTKEMNTHEPYRQHMKTVERITHERKTQKTALHPTIRMKTSLLSCTPPVSFIGK